jgi:hypothetical protein
LSRFSERETIPFFPMMFRRDEKPTLGKGVVALPKRKKATRFTRVLRRYLILHIYCRTPIERYRAGDRKDRRCPTSCNCTWFDNQWHRAGFSELDYILYHHHDKCELGVAAIGAMCQCQSWLNQAHVDLTCFLAWGRGFFRWFHASWFGARVQRSGVERAPFFAVFSNAIHGDCSPLVPWLTQGMPAPQVDWACRERRGKRRQSYPTTVELTSSA